MLPAAPPHRGRSERLVPAPAQAPPRTHHGRAHDLAVVHPWDPPCAATESYGRMPKAFMQPSSLHLLHWRSSDCGCDVWVQLPQVAQKRQRGLHLHTKNYLEPWWSSIPGGLASVASSETVPQRRGRPQDRPRFFGC